jgi:hypothetical protein
LITTEQVGSRTGNRAHCEMEIAGHSTYDADQHRFLTDNNGLAHDNP